MPTEYTCIIEDKADTTFREYALRCARGMGHCIMQRDDPMADPPKPRAVTPYHTDELKKARGKLLEAEGASPESMRALWLSHCASTAADNAKSAEKHAKEQAAYARVRADVVAWVPPSPDHEGLKRFMLEQIDMCYRPAEEAYRVEPFASPDAYRKSLIEAASWSLQYHEEHAAIEAENVAKSGRWIAELYASLPAEKGAR